MAPKGGKGGHSSSSSSKDGGGSSCPACTARLELLGSDWKDGKVLGAFALQIVAILIILLCLIFSKKFTWVKEGGGRDRLRNKGYRIAAIFAILSYTLYVVDTSLHETRTTVVYLYYILYIFASFFWRIADLLMIAIILRINTQSTIPGLWKRMHGLHVAVIVILGLASVAAFGLYTAQNVQVIRNGAYANADYEKDLAYAAVAYWVIFFLISCLATMEAGVVFLKERSKAALVAAGLIIPCLLIRSLVQLINSAVNATTSGVSYSIYWNLQWASVFADALMTPAIFAGIVLVGYLTVRKSRVIKQKEYKGTTYAPVNTYA